MDTGALEVDTPEQSQRRAYCDRVRVGLAYAAPHVRDTGQQSSRGRGHYPGSTIAHRAVDSVPIRSHAVDGNGYNCLNYEQVGA